MNFKFIPLYLASFFIVINPGLVATANSSLPINKQLNTSRILVCTPNGCVGPTSRPVLYKDSNRSRSQTRKRTMGNVQQTQTKLSTQSK